MLKIGIIRENKQPADKRTALTPTNCQYLFEQYGNELEIYVESSADRIFSDEVYLEKGCIITEDMSICDVLVGVKEVPIAYLIPNKTYFFFSHTIKEQPYNQKMLQEIIAKKIRLIDYETLATPKGRILGFGLHAGIVGAYNGLLTYGKKHRLFQLKPAHEMLVYSDLVDELQKIKLPPMKIALTGSGRVALGATRLLNDAGVKQVDQSTYLSNKHRGPVFINLEPKDLFVRKDGKDFDTGHFYKNHDAYLLSFDDFYEPTDLMINGIYWSNDMDVYFTKDQIAQDNFNISVIADITCDVEGSVPITYKATPIEDPVIGWDKKAQEPCAPFLKDTIDIMAVTNLPCELPADASELFGHDFASKVVPELFKEKSEILANATITQNGELTERYMYLQDYAFGPLINP